MKKVTVEIIPRCVDSHYVEILVDETKDIKEQVDTYIDENYNDLESFLVVSEEDA